ncbi:SGNH/GDSL hydrolase family protein [Flammeovirga aprica]|uniref:SGNH/GDSL hydrolase family protein n=1 Tax=Flammeovirga aprica JL-4 TaxID=694437 RepID=A0A7X9P2E2_9BACT|nr:SGNH/GDSL hydrolase family protein [Flammeovirga aprica]NME68060.1 SGNH/GDSL hydrolase family protein [Flammeovirga aprica JL-4]
MQISKAQLIEKINDLDLEDSELEQYLLEDDSKSEAFNVSYKVNPNNILNLSSADTFVLGYLNKRSRRIRRKRYNEKMENGFNGIQIVSEGDSWFQYPIFLEDVIDHLWENDQFGIYSLGYGGDWLSNIFAEEEYLKAVRAIQPDIFLMSGGGNDLAGNNRVGTIVKTYLGSRPADDYLNDEGEQFFREMKVLYKTIFDNVIAASPNTQIICHGYDYCIPRGQRWLGKPLADRGITDESLQADIIHHLFDKFNDMQIELVSNYENVHHVDLRGTVIETSGWKDEIHPTSEYFGKIAEKIEAKILEVVNRS